ncbi:UNVERIFIED_CONTAM: hypothetical protein Sradi_3638700 [Sesamum radiatum]|uniref:HAT C-terminal dimerisation domain-containing protein n=1 Tax=Sesamum radiatum TaxID=300843 RepID=A0AAW2QIK3_SESRA
MDLVEYQKSESESYLEEARFPRAETKDWWKTNSPRLPVLAKIARDISSPSHFASESAFSVGGRVIDESRGVMKAQLLQTIVEETE